MSIRGEVRFTRDVDLAVRVAGDSEREGLVRDLSAAGYSPLALVEQDDKGRLATVRLRSPSGVVVDLLAASSGIEDEVVGRATEVVIEGAGPIPVARAEELLALKVLSMTEKRPQDRLDAEALVAMNPGLDVGAGSARAHRRTRVSPRAGPRKQAGRAIPPGVTLRASPALSFVPLLGSATLAAIVSATPACSRFGAVYPPRPAPADAPPLAEPAPAKVVAHLTITGDGLRAALDDSVPRAGDGTVRLLGGDRKYTWQRGPLDVAFGQGRIEIRTRVQATLALPLKTLAFPLDLVVKAEPIIDTAYDVKLQGTEVHVTSSDRTLGFADEIAGVYAHVEDPIAAQLKTFHHDLKPLLGQAYDRVSSPITIPVGDANACANLKVLEVEAGPTVMADGLEKDVALVVAPSITMPCPILAAPDGPTLPPMSNVATLASGPFTLTVPVAARYDELTRAMTMAFTDGKLFFSKDFPDVFVEKPELYESGGVLVLKLHIAGPVHAMGIDTVLDGDLFLSGHPAVVDNELSMPDLEPTIETKNFLLSLKALSSGDQIRDQARAALRLDIGARVRQAQAKLGDSLTFGDRDGCFHGDVDRVEITGVYPHAGYLRVYVAVTGRARAEVPCR